MPAGSAWGPMGRWGARRAQAGVAWLLLLATLSVLSVGGMAVATRWTDLQAREREQELLRVGDAMARALASYRSTGAERRLPTRLEDLLSDSRTLPTKRHLRALPLDPITGQPAWGTRRDEYGGIVGVYSLSSERPWRQAPLQLRHVDLPQADHYSDWVFSPRERQ